MLASLQDAADAITESPEEADLMVVAAFYGIGAKVARSADTGATAGTTRAGSAA